MERRKSRLFGTSAAALAVAGVALWPTTGWVVRQQVATSICGLLPVSKMIEMNQRNYDRAASAARAKPGDFPIQLALATREGLAAMHPSDDEDISRVDRSEIVRRLTALEAKFPDQPSLRAAILRNLSNRITLDNRSDDAGLAPNLPTRTPAKPPRAEDLAAFDAAASAGERLDPNNAFFRMERAVALFADKRDSEACAEVIRAGAATRYDDYCGDEIAGNLELSTIANGEIGIIPRIAIAASQTFPHYGPLRAAARATTANAIEKELAGDREGGFALRSALMRAGSRMRTDASWIIGNLVGQAIARIGETRPGGEPALPKDTDNAHRSKMLESHYIAYLKSSGHGDEIPWVVHASESATQIKFAVDHGMETNAVAIGRLEPLMAFWAASMTILVNLLWVTIFGGLAALLCRAKTIRTGTGLPALSTGTIALASFAAFFFVAYVSGGLVAEYTVACGIFNQNSSALDDSYAAMLPRLLVAAFATSVVGGTVLFHAIRSRVKRVPVSVEIVRGVASSALPTIIVLGLAYAVTASLTGLKEAALRPLLTRELQHEGRFDAEAAGTPWPSYEPQSGETQP